MKTMTKVAAALAVLAGVVGLAIAAQADSRWHDRHGGSPQHMQQAYGGHGGHGMHDGRFHGGRHGMHREGRGGGRHMSRMMESFDTDQDGQLTQEEIDRTRGERFAAFDADGDQRLSLAEYEKLWLDAMRETMVDRFQHLDADGDAQVTAEEFKRPFSRMVRRMDHNDDGVIDRDDFRRRRHNGGDDQRESEEDNG